MTRTPKNPMVYPEKMTKSLRHVLSKLYFEFGPISEAFRLSGVEIERSDKAEQAYCLHWCIKLVLKYGDDWDVMANAELTAMAATILSKDGSL